MGQRRSVGRNAADRLLAAIGYPERISNTDEPFTLRVDGREVFVEESAGRIVLSSALTEDDSMLPTLAVYAAGRMLHEDATLAYGSFEVSKFRSLEGTAAKPLNIQTSKLPGNHVFLWQDAPADADDRTLVRLFESFADSCDWWRARVDERGKSDAVEISEAVIRP
jgi:hypothetical protein